MNYTHTDQCRTLRSYLHAPPDEVHRVHHRLSRRPGRRAAREEQRESGGDVVGEGGELEHVVHALLEGEERGYGGDGRAYPPVQPRHAFRLQYL